MRKGKVVGNGKGGGVGEENHDAGRRRASCCLQDATHFIYFEEDDDSIPTLSFLQRIRIGVFQKFVNTFADIFKLHPELVIQQVLTSPPPSDV